MDGIPGRVGRCRAAFRTAPPSVRAAWVGTRDLFRHDGRGRPSWSLRNDGRLDSDGADQEGRRNHAGGQQDGSNLSGGLLAEQVFLGSGEAPSLLPNDLIVVGARGSSEQTLRAAEAGPGPNAQPAVSTASAVQIAFLNLIDRPVIVKMSGDQATLARVVELLGQPADCAAEIHVFAPLGAGPRGSDSIDEATRPLDSGTVLVFPSPSIRLETLPALPEPIAETSLISPAAPSPQSGPMAQSGPTPGHSTGVPELHSPPAVGQAANLPLTGRQAASLPHDSTAARPSCKLTVTAELPVGPEVGDHSAIESRARDRQISPRRPSRNTDTILSLNPEGQSQPRPSNRLSHVLRANRTRVGWWHSWRPCRRWRGSPCC